MLNKVMIIGRLGRDPEVRYTQSGSAICNLTVATDESYTDQQGNRQQRAEWHRVVVFQRMAENCRNYLRKGSLVYVEGSLQTRKWQDNNGQERYTTEIRAQRVQFLDRRNDNGQQQGQPQRQEDLGPAYPQTQSPFPPQQAEIPGYNVPPTPSTMDEVPF